MRPLILYLWRPRSEERRGIPRRAKVRPPVVMTTESTANTKSDPVKRLRREGLGGVFGLVKGGGRAAALQRFS
jgi:hypothetical protein